MIAEFNPAAEKTFGHTSAEAIGKPLVDLLVPPPLRHEHTEGLRRYLDTGMVPSWASASRSGTEARRDGVSGRGRRGPDSLGRVARCPRATSATSPSGGKRRRQKDCVARRRRRRRPNSLLNAVIEGTSDAVYVRDREGRFLLVSTPGAALCGWPLRHGRAGRASFLPDDRASPSNEQDRLVMSDGIPRACESTVTMAGEEADIPCHQRSAPK